MGSIPMLRGLYEHVFGSGVSLDIFGNPKLLQGIEYEQDKVIPVRKKIKLMSGEDFSNFVNQYIGLIQKLWNYGIHENFGNFTLNNGYDSHKRLICVDFNEISFSREEVAWQIEEKMWLSKHSYAWLSAEKKAIFRNNMEKKVTKEELQKNWMVKGG